MLTDKSTRNVPLHVRTVAAIIVWSVVGLLLLNQFFRSELVLPISIVLTLFAVVLYFSPRIIKNTKPDSRESDESSTQTIQNVFNDLLSKKH